MDTSKLYRRQCKEAAEIQAEWSFSDGDYIDGTVWSGYDAFESPGYPNDGPWNPTQSQLQRMIKGDALTKLQSLWIFLNSFKLEPESLEQAWMQCVMYQKFNKIWNGKTWIKKGELYCQPHQPKEFSGTVCSIYLNSRCLTCGWRS